MKSFPCRLRRMLVEAQGSAAIEFALVLPLLLLLGFGMLEITRFVVAHERIVNAANSIADVISSQDTSDSDARYASFEKVALKRLMGSYWKDSAKLRVARFTHDGQTGTDIMTYAYPPGYAPALPAGFALETGQSMVDVSVGMEYAPMLPGLNIPGVGKILPAMNALSHTAYYPSRQSLLVNKPATLVLSGVSGNCACGCDDKPSCTLNDITPTEPPACTWCGCAGYEACPVAPVKAPTVPPAGG